MTKPGDMWTYTATDTSVAKGVAKDLKRMVTLKYIALAANSKITSKEFNLPNNATRDPQYTYGFGNKFHILLGLIQAELF